MNSAAPPLDQTSIASTDDTPIEAGETGIVGDHDPTSAPRSRSSFLTVEVTDAEAATAALAAQRIRVLNSEFVRFAIAAQARNILHEG